MTSSPSTAAVALQGRASEVVRLDEAWTRCQAGASIAVWVEGSTAADASVFVDAWLTTLPADVAVSDLRQSSEGSSILSAGALASMATLVRTHADTVSTLRAVWSERTLPVAVSGATPRSGALLLVEGASGACPAWLEPALSIAVGPLDVEAWHRWLADPDTARRLHALTGGRVDALSSLLADLPRPIDLCAHRFDRLSPAQRAVVLAVAAVGKAEVPAAVGIAGGVASTSDVLAGVEAGWLTARPGIGRTVYAPAPSVQDWLDDRLTASETRPVLERALAWLDGRRMWARAFGLGRRIDDARAPRWGWEAARAAIDEGNDAVAERLLREVVAARSSLSPELAREAWALLADVRERSGDLRGALAASGHVRRLLADDRGLRLRIASLCNQLGAARVALRLVESLLPRLEARSAQAEAAWIRAEGWLLTGQTARVLDVPVDPAADPVTALRWRNTVGRALLLAGSLDEASTVFGRNALAAEAAGSIDEVARARVNQGVVAHRQGDSVRAAELYEAAVQLGPTPSRSIAWANLGAIALEEGRGSDAVRALRQASIGWGRQGRVREQAHAAQNLARALLAVGRSHEALEVAAYSARLASRIPDPHLTAGAELVTLEIRGEGGDDVRPSLVALAERFDALNAARGSVEAKILHIEQSMTRGDGPTAVDVLATLPPVPPILTAWVETVRAEVFVSQGDIDRAGEAIERARAALLRTPHVSYPIRLCVAEAAVATLRNQVERAAEAQAEARELIAERVRRLDPLDRPTFEARRPVRLWRAAADPVPAPTPSSKSVSAPLPTVEGASTGVDPSSRTGLVGSSESLRRIKQSIARLAPTPTPVVVRGETGTGKELVARALHQSSGRRGAFVAVNCAALPDELLLSEMFGHEKGAFTGAVRERKGRFELADGGTLFLDEIGDISPRAQVALLRVLQERTFERVGGSRSLMVDVRIVCATHRDLESMVAQGAFREDLYWRLRGATLRLPPLRDRPEDLDALCDTLLRQVSERLGRPAPTLSPEVRDRLRAHSWPGNVRELRQVLETAVAVCTGSVIHTDDLDACDLAPVPVAMSIPASLSNHTRESTPIDTSTTSPEDEGPAIAAHWWTHLQDSGLGLRAFQDRIESECVRVALGESKGSISGAARLLGMTRSRLSQIIHADPLLRACVRPGESAPDSALAPAGAESTS